jgi:hypothetical protein
MSKTHNVSETGFYLRLEVKTETQSGLRDVVCFKYKQDDFVKIFRYNLQKNYSLHSVHYSAKSQYKNGCCQWG